GDDHKAIDRRLSDLANAVDGADFPTILEIFREIDRGLRAHIDGEERYLFDRFVELHATEIRELRQEHEDFRRTLDELSIQTELHTLRKERVDDLIARLRAHAQQEDHTLYKWTDDAPYPEERGGLFAFLEERRMALRIQD
ncbi:MAG: hemerythrin domain-containing protein, partial [Polyangiales bacterium]